MSAPRCPMLRIILLICLQIGCAASATLRVLPCSSWSGDTTSDGWSASHDSSVAASGALTVRNRGLCLDIEGGVPVLSACVAGKPSQQWRVDSAHKRLFNGATSVDDPHARCLTVAGTSYSVGPGVLLADCNPANPPMWHKPIPGYKWTWAVGALLAGNSSAIMSEVRDCCGDIWATRPVCLAIDKSPTCPELLASGTSAAWCDTSLGARTRAKALIANMTLDEKASNMDSLNFGVARLAVPPNLFSEALHGMCAGCGKAHDFPGEYTSTGCPTSFPQVISMGASWNRTLWTAVGKAVSDEVRGLYSQGSSILGGWESALFLWAPNINPFRGEQAFPLPIRCVPYLTGRGNACGRPAMGARAGGGLGGAACLRRVCRTLHPSLAGNYREWAGTAPIP